MKRPPSSAFNSTIQVPSQRACEDSSYFILYKNNSESTHKKTCKIIKNNTNVNITAGHTQPSRFL